MAFRPILHEPFDSVRYGRVLFVELTPGPAHGARCRYCRVFDDDPPPSRTHFSEPGAAAQEILGPLERGAAVDAVMLGGMGDPLRHRGLGTVLRQLRARAHVSTVLLSDGILLRDRDARRDAGEAETVVAWLPPLAVDRAAKADMKMRDGFERQVEGIASLRRETPTHIVLEIPVRSGKAESEESIDAWSRAISRIRPNRVLVVTAPGHGGDDAPAALETVRTGLPDGAGVFLTDETIADWRCLCDVEPPPEEAG